MKKIFLTLFIALPLLNACSSQNEQVSTMTESEARQLAESSCIKGGEALAAGKYDEANHTWSFEANLNATREGCVSACVVSEATQMAKLEWQCSEK